MRNQRNLPRSFDDLTGLRARGLIRESTVEQGDNSGPIVQERDEQEFAAKWKMLGPDQFYTDLVSGSDARKRPQFLQMIADAKAGAFDVLLVRETSRFARNWRQAGGYEEQLHSAGVVVAYIYEGRLSNDRAGQLQLVVNHAVNEEYREKLIENVRKGYRVKRFEALKFSGTPPFGYVMEYEDVPIAGPKGYERRETGRLIPDKEPQPRIAHGDTYTRADLALMIGQLYATGRYGHRALAAHLNTSGYRNAKGLPFTGGSLRHMLESPTYTGHLAWHYRKDKRLRGEGEELVRGPHEPLWGEELATHVAAVRLQQRKGQGLGGMKYVYPFRRITECDRCGAKMYGEAHRAVPYMACITQRERHACEERGVKSAVLEDQVGQWLRTLRIPDNWREDIERMQRGIAKVNADQPQVDPTKVQAQLDRLNDLYVMGSIGREEYVGRKRALDATQDGGTSQPTYSEAVLAQAARLLRDLGQLWDKATPEERSDIAHTLFARVRVRDQAIVSVRLADERYEQLVASAESRAWVGEAPPDGLEQLSPTFVVEHVDHLRDAILAA